MVRDPGRLSPLSAGLILLATILLHLALAKIIPPVLFASAEKTEATPARPLQVWLEPEPEEENWERFSYTNPNVPSNPPDQAAFFSDRATQAAQPEPTPEGDPRTADVPAEEFEETQNFLPGDRAMTEEEMKEWIEERAEPLPELAETRPIPGFEPAPGEGEAPAVQLEPAPEPQDESVIGVPVERAERPAEPREMAEAQPERVTPRPRPALPQFSRDPIGRREGAAPRVGDVSIDARFSEFGDYIARMLDVISRQWHVLAWEALRSSESGTMVIISFRLDAEGRVHGVEVLHSTASLTGTLIAQDAISARQPYGVWTRDMREVLGEEQTIRIRFFYR